MSTAAPIPTSRLADFLAAARRAGPRDFALVLSGVSWGFRISELLALTLVEVADHSGRVRSAVTLQRARLKFGLSVHRKRIRSRTVPVSDPLRAALHDYLFSRFGSGPYPSTAPLFAGRFPDEPLCRRQAQRIVQLLAVGIGLSPDLTWSTHTFRKTYAKAVYAASGCDIVKTQRALGHADIVTTQRYLPLDDAEVHDAISSAQASMSCPPLSAAAAQNAPFALAN